MKTVTVDQFLKFNPCYSEAKVKEIAREKKEWSALDILKLEGIPPEDKLWVVLREEFIDARILRLFVVWCARQCKQTTERYAKDEELKDTHDASRYASRYTVREAAWNAARSATLNAVWNTVMYTARHTDGYTAREEALNASRDAQVSHLIEMLEEVA